MSTAEKHFEDMLDSLLYQCVNGDLHYRLWRKFSELRSKYPNLKREHQTFFSVTIDSHYELFILSLCRLIDKSKKSTNLEEILKYGKSHIDIFKYSDNDRMTKIIDEDIKILKREEDLIYNILGQRHNYYAHLSKKYLTSFHQDVFIDFAVPNAEMYRLLREIIIILNHLNKNFRRTEKILGIFNEKQIECVDEVSNMFQKII